MFIGAVMKQAGSGWLDSFYPQSRGELYFMLDQGCVYGLI